MANTAFPAPTSSRGEFRCQLDGFQGKLYNNLYYMWQTSQLCDLTLRLAGNETLRVHSCLLAAFSPTVADILSNVDSHFQEKGEYSQKYITIDVQKFSSKVMKTIVSAVYTGQLVVSTIELMEQVLIACRWLRMDDLIIVLEPAMRERNRNAIGEPGRTGFRNAIDDTGRSGFKNSMDDSGRTGYSSNEPELFSPAKLLSPTPFTAEMGLREEYREKFPGIVFPRPEPMSDNYKPRLNALNSGDLRDETFTNSGFPSTDRVSSDECGLNLMHALGDQKVKGDDTASGRGASNVDEPSSAIDYGKSLDTPRCEPVSHDDDDKRLSSHHDTGSGDEMAPLNDDLDDSESANQTFNEDGSLRGNDAAMAGSNSDAGMGPSNSDESGNKRKRARPKKRIILDCPPQENDAFADPTLATGKTGEGEANASGEVVVVPSGPPVPERKQPVRGKSRQKKNAQKWVEQFFTNCLYSYDKNFLEAVVPHIKREVNVLATYLNSSSGGSQDMEIKSENDDDDIPGTSSSDYIIDSLSLMQFYDNQDYGFGNTTGRKKGKRKGFPRVKLGKGGRPKKRKVAKEPVLDADGNPIPEKPKKARARKKPAAPKPERKKRKKIVKLSTRVLIAGENGEGIGDAEVGIIDQESMQLAEAENLRKVEIGESAKCIKCGIVFTNAEQYKAHVNNHPIFSCPDCPAKFYLKRPLTSHRYAAHLDHSYLSCKVCTFKAKTAKELCIHSDTVHGQPRPFKCEHPDCTFRGKKYSDVQRHFKQIHSNELEFFCEKCGAGFTYKSLYMYHRERCLKNEKHLCYRCGSVFHAKNDLTMHIAAVHFKIKKYKCTQCDHRFASHGNLKRHMYVHNNVFPYTCPHCQEKFRHSNTYKLHMESKHSSKPPRPAAENYYVDNSYHEGIHRHAVMEDAMTAATLTCLVPQWYAQM